MGPKAKSSPPKQSVTSDCKYSNKKEGGHERAAKGGINNLLGNNSEGYNYAW
jgi:hypothetical protein